VLGLGGRAHACTVRPFQVLLAMQYLHDQNIVHRDIKPENILYTKAGGNDIKLIDFGYAGLWSENKPLTGLCGTPDYVAPEVLTWYDDDEQGTPYGKGSDLWSMGVLLYVILSGCSPFSADEEEELLQQVRTLWSCRLGAPLPLACAPFAFPRSAVSAAPRFVQNVGGGSQVRIF